MTLSDLANLVEALSFLTIVFGVIFGIAQLKQHRRQKRDLAILECAQSFEDSEFTEAYRLLSELKDGIELPEFEAMGEVYEAAIVRVGMKFETVGLLVFKGVVPLDAMEDLVGDAALRIWGVIEQWVIDSRAKRSHAELFEWYQWLVDRLRERRKQVREPAYVAHSDWREPKI